MTIISYQKDAKILFNILFGKNVDVFSLIKLVDDYYIKNKNIPYSICKVIVLMKSLNLNIYSPVEVPDHIIFDYIINPYDRYPLANNYEINLFSNDEITIKNMPLMILPR